MFYRETLNHSRIRSLVAMVKISIDLANYRGHSNTKTRITLKHACTRLQLRDSALQLQQSFPWSPTLIFCQNSILLPTTWGSFRFFWPHVWKILWSIGTETECRKRSVSAGVASFCVASSQEIWNNSRFSFYELPFRLAEVLITPR